MADVVELETPRLLLRAWQDEDLAPFAALNADPEVMAHFPALLTREQSDANVGRIRAFLAERGWGLWAVEVRETGRFIGFTGLSVPRFDAPFMPAVEVGWRLSRDAWGHGYATEAGRASLRHGFEHLDLDEVVAMIVPGNLNSQSVARKLDLVRDPAGDFDHPMVPEDAPAGSRTHWLYRINRERWAASERDRDPERRAHPG